HVMPQLFEKAEINGNGHANGNGAAHANGNGHLNGNGHPHANGNGRRAGFSPHVSTIPCAPKPARQDARAAVAPADIPIPHPAKPAISGLRTAIPSIRSTTTATVSEILSSAFSSRPRLRHSMETYVVGPSNQLAYNAALYVAEFPGAQYNPLFIHGNCGLGKTHLLQGLCKRFAEHHPTKRWMYLTGEECTNEFLSALRTNKLHSFRRKVSDMYPRSIDDVHFRGGKRATQEEFRHTFNAIEAMGRQVVLASDEHPKMITEFGESLVNLFVSGMVVRIDPPNFATRCQILRAMGIRGKLNLP